MDNDEHGRSLLEPLRDHATPLSNLDIDGAVAAGRRRVRVRRWAGAGAAAAVFFSLVPVSLAIVDRLGSDTPQVALELGQGTQESSGQSTAPSAARPAPPPFPVACTARALPLPAGVTSASVDGGDPSGRYLVGSYEDEHGNRRPLLWDDGKLVSLFTPGQDNSSIVVNEQGVVAGSSATVLDGKRDFINWIYRNGTVRPLTEVGHGQVEYRGVIDINARGDILLDSREKVMSVQAQHEGPAIWSNGQLRELPVPGRFKDVSANSLDDDGTVVGRHMLHDGFAGERPLIWTPDGKVEEPKAPNGFGPAGSLSHVRGSYVAGAFKAPGKPDHEPVELVGDLGKGAFSPTGIRMAFGMNRHGWVAGFEAGPQRTQIPTIAGAGGKLTLPLPPGTKAADEMSAVSISDDGRTVGGTVAAAGRQDLVPVAWTCRA